MFVLKLQKILETSKQGKILREGIATAIIGRPNVGKSSLLNSLVQEKKAIVTDIAGTTRDVIEEYVNVRGVPLKLIDTAGIRETEDVVERIGVERSKEMMSQADLVLVVVNYSEALTNEDEELFRAVQGKDFIVIVNKTDLPQAIDMERVIELAAGNRVITTSLIEEQGIDELEKAIADLFFEGTIDSADVTYVSNAETYWIINTSRKNNWRCNRGDRKWCSN